MSELNNQNRHDYSKYDEMSTEALEQILRLDFGSLDETESDIDAILYISEVIEKRKRQSNEIDVDTAWEKFKTKYHPYTDGRSLYDFGDEDSNQTSEEGISKISLHNGRNLLRFRRLMIVAALLVACLFGGIMVAQASGIDVFGALAKWTEDAFSFGDITEQGAQKASSALSEQSVQANTQDLSIKTAEQPKEFEEMKAILEEDGQTLYFPQIPTEFRLVDSSLYINPRTDETTFMVGYENEDTFVGFQVIQYCNRMPAAIHEKDNTIMEEYEFSGIMHYIFGNNGATSAVWLLNNIEYTLWTNSESLDIKELVQSTYCEGLL